MEEEFNSTEASLYAQGKALQTQARAKRRARVEEQKRIDAAADKIKADDKAAFLKAERDNRIRRALLNVADAVKKEGLAFDAPWGFYGTSPKQHAFNLIDKKEGGKIAISTHPTGFSWD